MECFYKDLGMGNCGGTIKKGCCEQHREQERERAHEPYDSSNPEWESILEVDHETWNGRKRRVLGTGE